MNEEKDRIERMLAEGRVTREEADGLLAALEKSQKEESFSMPGGQTEEPRMCAAAVVGALGVPAAIVLSLILVIIDGLLSTPHGPDGAVSGSSAGPVFMLVMFIGFVLSIIALFQISGSRGRLRGKGLAIAGIVMPILFLFMFAVLGSNEAVDVTPPEPGESLREVPATVETELPEEDDK